MTILSALTSRNGDRERWRPNEPAVPVGPLSFLSWVVRTVGLEPTRRCHLRILSPVAVVVRAAGLEPARPRRTRAFKALASTVPPRSPAPAASIFGAICSRVCPSSRHFAGHWTSCPMCPLPQQFAPGGVCPEIHFVRKANQDLLDLRPALQHLPAFSKLLS
jgi:hypothetical protein